ncbi:alpha-amylase family protein [Anaerocolumna sp. MB42-C2]|uniref:alpha-amylase family protein n=1 Tax=Anaerocolumna sp. MB42-C2 TaxID=3070997 RepID=UPI0027E023CF|nr:alpha-amylase family protein [Anaerocolumna sp. MB42-C2]WMJ88925.1 hypothetical protein RBU59_05235 [Anaerocolumna sp. MB42-C2]
MVKKTWWQKPLRIIQYNLQVKDTPMMNPKKIAEDLKELEANAVVLNVGGIYAWYPSKIKYHHINEYLPTEYDLLEELLRECHNLDIKVIARFDFSKTDDYVYLEKPSWFVCDTDKKPRIYGKDRMGEWSLLVTTCVNGGYRNEDLAMPVVKEVLDNYKIDGIFFNAPHVEECHCGVCKSKYFNLYGKELPESKEDFEPDWASICLRDNIGKIYGLVKEIRPEVPVILYYSTFEEGGKNRIDNLDDRYATADLICTEAQDVLSKGFKRIPQSWKPALNMKIGNSMDNTPNPFGIIHSSPGMDWRHTGMPIAEYLYWMSQVPANKGNIWHSLTGFNDTISDKRILHSVGLVNKRIKKCEPFMEDAVSLAQVLLLWNGSEAAMGWAEAMMNTQYQFDLLDELHLSLDKLKAYPVVLVPDNFNLTREVVTLLQDFVSDGGKLILENTNERMLTELADFIGIKQDKTTSPPLLASYIRFEAEGQGLKNSLNEVELLPHREKVLYCTPGTGTRTLLTLVPPFAPMDGVGAPPERASMCISHTDLPLCTLRDYKKGQVLFLPFELSKLALEYKFNEYYTLMKNCLDLMLGEQKQFSMDMVGGLQAMVYGGKERIMIHLVNGIGQRPLANNIPYHNLQLRIKPTSLKQINDVTSVIGESKINWEEKDGYITINLEQLDFWDMILIR